MGAKFYAELPIRRLGLSKLLVQPQLFRQVPQDWQVIITDIKGSTRAVSEGKHEQVNLVATGSIVAVLNIVYAKSLAIPFFFGGDGATFLVPPDVFRPVMQTLAAYRQQTLTNLELDLRIGNVPVAAIYQAGEELLIAKYQLSAKFMIPVVLGNGLNYAEKSIKGEDALSAGDAVAESPPDLNGMQCRWDRILPPADQEEVVTLLVVVRDPSAQGQVFSQVIQLIDQIYGPAVKRQPISVRQLRLKSTFKRLGSEMLARAGRIKIFELVGTWLTMLYGYLYFRTERGQYYLKSMVEMSDTLVIDGKINTVISGTVAQRNMLTEALKAFEDKGDIFYGIYNSPASIMSCYVRDLVDSHIHFVDGSDGGYTEAARMLKAKLNPN